MYRLVLWAFKLGQQTERHRIAGILNDHRTHARNNVIERALFVEEDKKDPKRDQERRAIEREIDSRVADIVNAITQPNQFEESRYSLLFPKDGK